MGDKELRVIETEVIEPEVLDENGRPVNEKPQPHAGAAVHVTRGVLAVISALVFTFLFSLLMALLALVIFIPVMILKMLGLVKSDFKIYRK